MQTNNALYLIYMKNGKISVSEYRDDEFVPLTFNGENTLSYHDDFWKLFKEKIEYDNEPLSFVVASDTENFQIDNSICIATENSVIHTSNLALYIRNKPLFLLTFPKVDIDLLLDETDSSQIDETNDKQEDLTPQQASILTKYYKKRTEEYNHDR